MVETLKIRLLAISYKISSFLVYFTFSLAPYITCPYPYSVFCKNYVRLNNDKSNFEQEVGSNLNGKGFILSSIHKNKSHYVSTFLKLIVGKPCRFTRVACMWYTCLLIAKTHQWKFGFFLLCITNGNSK